MKKFLMLCVLCLIGFSNSLAQVQVGDKGELSGLVFGDYFWMAAHHNDAVEANNGFWFRRIYVTYDRDIGESFTSRVRLEMNTNGDFSTSTKMTPVVKDAWLRWDAGNHEIYFGIAKTPTWALVEEVWGYRSVEKTPLDLQDFGSSRDFGIAATGTLGESGKFEYHAMFGNGNSNSNETDVGKKSMLSLTYHLTDRIIMQVYGDWNDRPGDTDWLTAQGFLGYRSDNLNAGLLYAHQVRNMSVGGDLDLDLASAFARFALSGAVTGFLRVDRTFDPMPGVDSYDYLPLNPNAESTFVTGGVDIEPHENIHLIPNIETVFYGETAAGTRPDTDIVPRITLYYSF